DDNEVDRLHDADEGALPRMQEHFAEEDDRDADKDDTQSEPDAIEEESVDALDEIRRTAVLGRQPRFGSRHVNLLAATIPANRERCQRAPRLRTGRGTGSHGCRPDAGDGEQLSRRPSRRVRSRAWPIP